MRKIDFLSFFSSFFWGRMALFDGSEKIEKKSFLEVERYFYFFDPKKLVLLMNQSKKNTRHTWFIQPKNN
ncbi:hypothetical protein [Italian clover phyllody phytoplasma]|uniref:hypothetical protein n=1 Tax=Italian clover phyllody phytoplasma TaxID=1196420 RepID=UPI000376A9E1|nr:hypothetical protein [Italian clover phyllody phytoplasma]